MVDDSKINLRSRRTPREHRLEESCTTARFGNNIQVVVRRPRVLYCELVFTIIQPFWVFLRIFKLWMMDCVIPPSVNQSQCCGVMVQRLGRLGRPRCWCNVIKLNDASSRIRASDNSATENVYIYIKYLKIKKATKSTC